MTAEQIKTNIKEALQSFAKGNLTEKSLTLFENLGYITERRAPLHIPTYLEFRDTYIGDKKFDESKARISNWKYVDLLFQLSKEELLKQTSLFDTKQVNQTVIETYLFFAIELIGEQYSRTELSLITREVNRLFPMPAMILFKHGQMLTLSVINRRLHKLDYSKDVLEKVTLIKDIIIENPHRAHIEILFDLSFNELKDKHQLTNFVELHNAWQKTLDTKELNKRFYSELFNWYLWAVRSVNFPNDLNDDKDNMVYNSESVIRLLTRLIFVWFIKEKKLVPDSLFELKNLKDILKDFNPQSKETSIYYRAILQNLFFATLNTPMDKDITAENKDEQRRFIYTLPKTGNDQYLDQTKYRYQNYFTKPDKALELFSTIPFLNGGLFECLDFKEGNKEIRLDGFSSTEKRQAFVPDNLFFADEFVLDLNSEYGTKGKKYKVEGLINILNGYKFTITENTPLEEEIALDPELLGKVFENLLASYNPETKSTARKQTGSFYTPREIVNYMVDESLIAYFKQKTDNTEETENKLRDLFSHTIDLPEFSKSGTDDLIKAISESKILDPACGSGAFPMGVLHRLVDLLNKLDPNNKKWNELQKQRAISETAEVFESGDVSEREIRLNEINKAFDLSMNYPDYARKLFLIENCIYGVDIQQIAIQISKLRFFISLIVDQKVDDSKHNRNILSMPNLETKFVAANTLIDLDKPQQMTLMASDVDKLEKELASIRHKNFFTRKYSAKKALKKNEKTKRQELQTALTQSGFNKNVAAQMAGWNPFDPMQSAKFFDPETMFGFKEGFDVVIGNPPYIGQKGNNDIFRPVKDSKLGKQFHQRRMDYFYFFFHQALNLSAAHGVINFITTNYYITATYADLLRKDFKSRASVRELINFNELRIFESALGQHNLITFLTKDNNNHPVKVISTQKTGFADAQILKKILCGTDEDTNYFQMPDQNIYDGDLNYIRLQNEDSKNSGIDNILEIVKNAGKPLSDICFLTTGVQSGAEKLTQGHINKYAIAGNIGEGIFILNKEEIRKLELSEIEKVYLKPYFKNSDIQKWVTNEHSIESLIYYTSKTLSKIGSPLLNHFEKYKPILINRNTRSGTPAITSSVYDKFVKGNYEISYVMIASAFKRGAYYCVSYARDEEYFVSPKIVAPQRSALNTFGYNETEWFGGTDIHFIITKDKKVKLKYILALLNSKLYYRWLYHKGKRKGEILELVLAPLSEIPIKIADAKTQAQFEFITDKIISGKKKNKDTSDLEKQVDKMVYELYELTEEQIKIVEGN